MFTYSFTIYQVNIKLLKDGMKIEARHVRRKQLMQYLDSEFLRTERNLTENSLNNLYSNIGNSPQKKRLSTETVQNAANKKTRVNESVSIFLKLHI